MSYDADLSFSYLGSTRVIFEIGAVSELPIQVAEYGSKVVLVTTSNHPVDRERAMRDPLIFGYLLKPVSVEKLNEILKSVSPAKTA